LSRDRPNNLHSPLPEDYGAHGAFDRNARSFSVQSWMDRNRGWLGLGGLSAIAWYMMTQSRRRQKDGQMKGDHTPQ